MGSSGRRVGREEAEVKGGKVGRWEGGKVGRSRGEGRRARDTIESGTQELKRIKVSRGGAEARRWEGRGAKGEGSRAWHARPLLRSRYG